VPLAAALAALAALAAGPDGAGDPAARWWLLAGALWYAALTGAAVLRPLIGRLDWLVPPLLRAAEYGTLVSVTAALAPGALSSAFAALAVVVYHHYDAVYRLRTSADAPPSWLVSVIGGQEGRVVLVGILAVGGASALRTVLPVLAIGLALVVVAESVHFWTRGGTARHETGETP
jgi:hypothetical protein